MPVKLGDILTHAVFILFFPPLMLGVITKTKAAFAGRVGAPLLQPYYDLIKLLQKGSVFSRTTTWVFRAGPVVGVATALLAAALVPIGGRAAPIPSNAEPVSKAAAIVKNRPRPRR